MVRTVEGPRPLSVLWRRLDAAFMDPLELKHDSRIGTPGLVDAVRHGGATIVNAIGSGILETRALLAFLPGICRHLLGEDLTLPHIATWWCGQEAERAHVLANLDRMMIGQALATLPPVERQRGHGAGLLAGRSRARGARRAARRRRRRVRRAGIGHAVDHALLRRGQARAAPGDAARLRHAHALRLDGDAGRLRSRRRIARHGGDRHAPGRPRRRCLGSGRGAGRARHAAAGPGGRSGRRQADGDPAQPRRRQPLLARPLYRARRGHGAGPARLSRPLRRSLAVGGRVHAADDRRQPRRDRHRRAPADPRRARRQHRCRRSRAPGASATASRPTAGWR